VNFCSGSRSYCLIAGWLTSCLTPVPQPQDAEKTETRNTATLEGFVVEMDGHYTRNDGAAFEFPTGCHVFKTTADNLIAATESSGVVVHVRWIHVPVAHFKVEALPGYRYRVEHALERIDNQANIMVVVLRVFEPNGSMVSTQRIAAGPLTDQSIPICAKGG
jgi:hypothetical protein